MDVDSCARQLKRNLFFHLEPKDVRFGDPRTPVLVANYRDGLPAVYVEFFGTERSVKISNPDLWDWVQKYGIAQGLKRAKAKKPHLLTSVQAYIIAHCFFDRALGHGRLVSVALFFSLFSLLVACSDVCVLVFVPVPTLQLPDGRDCRVDQQGHGPSCQCLG